MKNNGLKLGKRLSDYVAGVSSPLKYEVINPSGDWRLFVPKGEKQWFLTFDTFNCTGFSNNNSAEIQLRFYGFDFNFSDRAMSVLAECMPNGNWMYKPADVGRNIGRILEQEYPAGDPKTWQEYNQPLTPEVMAKMWRFEEKYEWISTDKNSLIHHLKNAPLLITIPLPDPNHVVVLVYVSGNTGYYFDSYEGSTNFIKTIDLNLISSALKLIVKPMITTTVKFADGKTLGVLIDTPNGAQIIKATGEEQWRSWNKPDSYGLPTVNSDGSTNWNANLQLPF